MPILHSQFIQTQEHLVLFISFKDAYHRKLPEIQKNWLRKNSPKIITKKLATLFSSSHRSKLPADIVEVPASPNCKYNNFTHFLNDLKIIIFKTTGNHSILNYLKKKLTFKTEK
ncbi:hypothetical protein CAEBREN_04485 [Caenorhabditis brenneri]|uniref:Uncharacterized protein n=1 Tax=Caenorhabditis brenneri TaxID=135651 RepID=G0NJV1_CAEBE|nr:hypothetical protein CAEBREN_04485 [Caenorhabditis brenneri]